jgi:hypothetical protein
MEIWGNKPVVKWSQLDTVPIKALCETWDVEYVQVCGLYVGLSAVLRNYDTEYG